MRKWIILLALCVAFIGCEKSAEAHSKRKTTTVIQEVASDDGTSITGVKIDAPNLVKIDKEGKWTLGAEGGKSVMRGIFGDERSYVEADKGYFAFVKVTYNGCLLRCNEE